MDHTIHMMAGAAAGMMEHCLMFPMDTVKTRLQISTQQVNIAAALTPQIHHEMRNIVKNEGFSRLWKGVGVVALAAGPAHAIYFATYEFAKEMFGGKDVALNSINSISNSNYNNNSNNSGNNKGSDSSSEDDSSSSFFQRFVRKTRDGGLLGSILTTSAAGVMATFTQDAIMTPFDVIKQRMQVHGSPFKNMIDCSSAILKKEGFRAFYVSFPTTLMMNIPFVAVYFTTYEHMFPLLSGAQASEDEEEDGELYPLAHIIAGACGGAAAAAISNPFDVAKTRLQTRSLFDSGRQSEYHGLWSTFRSIWIHEGPAAFFKGIRARMLFHIPAAAIALSTYATVKHFLKKSSKQQ